MLCRNSCAAPIGKQSCRSHLTLNWESSGRELWAGWQSCQLILAEWLSFLSWQMHTRLQGPLTGWGRNSNPQWFVRVGRGLTQEDFNQGSVGIYQGIWASCPWVQRVGDLASRLTQERSTTMRYHLSEDSEVLRVDGQAGIAEAGHFNSTPASPVYSSFPERWKETHIHQSSKPRWLPENTEYWSCLLNKLFQITFPPSFTNH